ncbi:MAG TPA: phosphate acyltransferase [Anaeromyxobacter sp.]
MMPIPTLARLLEEARTVGPLPVVVAGAENDTALTAVAHARRKRIAEVVLVGGAAGIRARLAALGEDPERYRIVEAASDAEAARRAVALVRAGEGAVLMKGRIKTGDLLHAVLDRAGGLREGRLLSDVLVAEHPLSEEARLVGVTDGGVNVAPTLAQKREILANAVALFRRLGHPRPRVACLCAVETVTPAMPHTMEAQILAEENAAGELRDCVVSGPLALDNALSEDAARAKGIDHPVAGRADVLLVPTIETGNALGKAFTYLAKKPVAHVIVGAKAPVLIPSRVERAEDKLCSIALGVVCAERALP